MSGVSIHPDLLLSILYGSPDGPRFTQDSPVLPDVWEEYARNPGEPVSGLIVPRKAHQAHQAADEIYERLLAYRKHAKIKHRHSLDVADFPGLMTVRCHFDEVVNVILPLTRWWDTDGMRDLVKDKENSNVSEMIFDRTVQAFTKLQALSDPKQRAQASFDLTENGLGHLGIYFRNTTSDGGETARASFPDSTARLLLALGAMQAATKMDYDLARALQYGVFPDRWPTDANIYIRDLGLLDPIDVAEGLLSILDLDFLGARDTPLTDHYRKVVDRLDPDGTGMGNEETLRLVFTLNLNRLASGAVFDSVKTAKADAARRLFSVSNSAVTWAVVDGGIDAQHRAFRDYVAMPETGKEDPKLRLGEQNSRVDRRYNVALISHLRDRDTMRNKNRRDNLAAAIAKKIDLPGDPKPEEALPIVTDMLEEIARELNRHRQIDWDLMEPIMRVRHDDMPAGHHGTHVAGILGGAWTETHDGKRVHYEGMCPDIRLMDFNVLSGAIGLPGDAGEATEFAVIAALRLIRHLNDRNDFKVIHGANLSLAIKHDVSNYACGRTPVCVESETLVSTGVVVVAAAGNAGYNVFKTKNGEVPLHTEASIADPGNAENVITVGSTHRLEPHTYGVSYFSSRGPTGDGRMKPDLVAPGEKIHGPICNNDFARLEGTSMAAPHVSGAAALLMARFPELIGQPERIKQILCDSATDLGRERAYQGAGLVDILRALQSV